MSHNSKDFSDSDLINSSIDNDSKERSNYFKTNVQISSSASRNREFSLTHSSRPTEGSLGLSGKGAGKVVVSVKCPDRKSEISVRSSYSRRKRVDAGTQSERHPVGEEDKNKCVRPPLVGQASAGELSKLTKVIHSSSESESDQVSEKQFSQAYSQSAYFPETGGLKDAVQRDQPSSLQSDVTDSQRGPSPATARMFEWDSGADVGYRKTEGCKLSREEELALGSSRLLSRGDPEGTTSAVSGQPLQPPQLPSPDLRTVRLKGQPSAESTPKERPQHLFPEVVVVTRENSVSPVVIHEPLNKKLSSSLEEIPVKAGGSNSTVNNSLKTKFPSTFPRSQSHADLPISISVKPSAAESFDVKRKGDRSQRLSDSESNGDRHSVRSDRIKNDHNDGTLESGVMSADARVNSFEYLPGHVFENANKVQSDSSGSDGSVERRRSPSGSLQEEIDCAVDQLVGLLSNSGYSEPELKRSILHRLIERIVNTDYPEDINDPDSRIPPGQLPSAVKNSQPIPSPERKSSVSALDHGNNCSPSALGNDSIEEHNEIAEVDHDAAPYSVRGQISGESSTERSPPPILPQLNNSVGATSLVDKCVGTGVSTSLSGCTEETQGWCSTRSSSIRSGAAAPTPSARPLYCRRKMNSRSIPDQSDYAKSSDVLQSDGEVSKQPGVFRSKGMDDVAMLKAEMDREKRNHLFWISSEIHQLNCLKRMLETHEEMKTCYSRIRRWKQKMKKFKVTQSATQTGPLLKQPCSSDKDTSRVNSPSTCTSTKSQSTTETGWTSHQYDSEGERSRGTEKIKPSGSFRKKFEGQREDGRGDRPFYRQPNSNLCMFEYKEKAGRRGNKVSASKHYVSASGDAQNARNSNHPSTVSYTLGFPSKSEPTVKSDVKAKQQSITSADTPSRRKRLHHRYKNEDEENNIMLSVGELRTAIDNIVARHRPSQITTTSGPSLKECFESQRPDLVSRVEARRRILSEITELRQARQAVKEEILAGVPINLPPPPLGLKRIVSQKELRRQTERKYKQLAEVCNKRAELKRKQDYRTNRLMAQVFNRKLQKKTLQGQVNLSNSVCVIGSS